VAATAIAHGARLATADRGMARFPGLRLVNPLRGSS
jgi:predicted nucleic acid-binding protein